MFARWFDRFVRRASRSRTDNVLSRRLRPCVEALEDALARLGNEADPRVDGAGRTDAGVHAEGQVIAFAYDGRLTGAELGAALDARLLCQRAEDVFIVHHDLRWNSDRASAEVLPRLVKERAIASGSSSRSCGTRLRSKRRSFRSLGRQYSIPMCRRACSFRPVIVSGRHIHTLALSWERSVG